MQPSLITLANDNEVNRPGGTQIQRQFYRSKDPQGSGIYKAMDENGNIEIIGGPGASSGDTIESGTFVKPSTDLSGAQLITTTKRPKMVFISAKSNASNPSAIQSDGKSDVVTNNCQGVIVGTLTRYNDRCISITNQGLDNDSGWDGIITAFNPTSFEIDWTKQVNGFELEVQWFAITS